MAEFFLQTNPPPPRNPYTINHLQTLLLALQNVIPITSGSGQDATRQAHNWTKHLSTCVEPKLLWKPTRYAQCRLSVYGVSGFITWRQTVRSIRLAPAVLKNTACGNVKKDMRRRAWQNEICARSESTARNMEGVPSSSTAWRRKWGESQCIKSNIKPNSKQIQNMCCVSVTVQLTEIETSEFSKNSLVLLVGTWQHAATLLWTQIFVATTSHNIYAVKQDTQCGLNE